MIVLILIFVLPCLVWPFIWHFRVVNPTLVFCASSGRSTKTYNNVLVDLPEKFYLCGERSITRYIYDFKFFYIDGNSMTTRGLCSGDVVATIPVKDCNLNNSDLYILAESNIKHKNCFKVGTFSGDSVPQENFGKIVYTVKGFNKLEPYIGIENLLD